MMLKKVLKESINTKIKFRNKIKKIRAKEEGLVSIELLFSIVVILFIASIIGKKIKEKADDLVGEIDDKNLFDFDSIFGN